MKKSRVYEWHKRFRDGRESVNDDRRSGRPIISTNDSNIERVQKVEEIASQVGSCRRILRMKAKTEHFTDNAWNLPVITEVTSMDPQSFSNRELDEISENGLQDLDNGSIKDTDLKHEMIRLDEVKKESLTVLIHPDDIKMEPSSLLSEMSSDDENNLVTVANSSIQEEPWKIPVKIEINEEQSKECYPASPNNEDFNQSREEIYYGNLYSNTKGEKNLSLAEVMVEPPHQQQLIKTNTKQSVSVEISTYDEVPFPVEVKLEPLDDPVQSEPEWIIPDDNFSQEVNVDKNNEMYCCYTCQKLFPSLEELNHHFSEYHLCNSITVEYNCQSCDFSTPVLTDLQKHSELHKIKPFKCSHCDKTFEFQRYLIQHEVVHSAEKWFECEICNRKFRRHCDYKMHIPTHTEDPFPCNVCGKQFKLYRSLLQHEIVHKEPEKKHVCIVCGKRFRRQCDYFTHAKTHTNEPFKCKHCDKSFSLKRNLLQHEVVHTQEKSIECDICGKKFRRHCDYKVHAFFHSGIKSHTCSVCGKSFTLKRSLMLHSATHSVLRRVLKCLKCNKTFNTHWRLYKHGPCYENSFDELNEQDQSELCNLNKYSRNININKKGLHETVSRIQECMATEQDQSELPVPELNLTDCCNVRFSENTTDEKISQLQESVTSEEHSELIPIVCNTNFENN